MFAGYMLNAWESGTMVAVVAGVVGFFVVLRGSAFQAHAIPNGAFAGAAGANLLGLSPLLGLGVFSVLGALAINTLTRRAKSDVATALVLVLLLAIGAAFLSQSTQYEPQIYSLLFGEIVGVSTAELLPTALLGLVCILCVIVLFRPLLLTSVSQDVAKSRGVNNAVVDGAFLLVVALATTMTIPVVGSFLIFSLLIGPAAAARVIAQKPSSAVLLSVATALAVMWGSLLSAYTWNWPIGFFVGTYSAVAYVAAVLSRRLRTQ